MRLRKSSGLVLNLRMDEGSGTVAGDSSRYGNDGAVNGGVVWAENGMRFDGSTGYLDCGNDESLNITDAITFSTWLKAEDLSEYRRIVTNIDTVNKFGYDIFLDDEGRVLFQLGVGTGYKDCRSNNVVDDNLYYHVVCTWAGASLKMYIDGNEVDYYNQDTIASYSQSNNDILIGKYSGGGFFAGTINDVRIHNRALSAREIMKYYEATKQKYL